MDKTVKDYSGSIKLGAKVSVLTLIAAAATGCASNGLSGGYGDKTAAELAVQEPVNRLEAISLEIRDEVRLLAKIRQETREANMTERERQNRMLQKMEIPAGFETRIDTLQVTDDLEDVIKLIALQAGYEEPVFTGNRPRHELPITLNLKNTQLYDAVMEIGVQTDDAVMINIYPNNKRIVVEYKDRI
jgi:hypothetical protein